MALHKERTQFASRTQEQVIRWIRSLIFCGAVAHALSSAADPFLFHIYEGNFAPFTKNAFPLEKGNSTLSRVELWNILRSYEHFITSLELTLNDSKMSLQESCQLSVKNLMENLALVKISKEQFTQKCLMGGADPSCDSHSQKLWQLIQAIEGIQRNLEQDCTDEVPRFVLPRRIDGSKAWQGEVSAGGGYNSDDLKASTFVSATQRKSPTARVGGNFAWEQDRLGTSLAAEYRLQESKSLYDVQGHLDYSGVTERFSFVALTDVSSRSDLLTADRSSAQSLGKVKGRYGIFFGQSEGTSLLQVSYLPTLMLTSQNVYSALIHGAEIFYGYRGKTLSENNGFFMAGFKGMPFSGSILPGWQQIVLAYRAHGLALGSGRALVELGLQEVRDEDYTVRLLPHAKFEIQSQRQAGPSFLFVNSALNSTFSHEDKLGVFWGADYDLSAPIVRQFVIKPEFDVYWKDLLKFALAGELIVKNAYSLRPAGGYEVQQVGLDLLVEYGVMRNLWIRTRAYLSQSIYSDPANVPDPRAWSDPRTSHRQFLSELGVRYDF